MKVSRFAIGFFVVALLSLATVQAMAVAPYTYVVTGASAQFRWSAHINASGDVAFTNGAGPGGTVGVYDYSSGTVTDLGNPSTEEMDPRGFTDSGRIVSTTNYGTGYGWFYDPTVGDLGFGTGWVRSWNTTDAPEATSQTRALVRAGNSYWYIELDDVFNNAGDYGKGPGTINPADRVGAGAESGFSYAADINNTGDAVGDKSGAGNGWFYDVSADSWTNLPVEVSSRLSINDAGLIAGTDGSGSNGYVYDGATSTLIGAVSPTAINNNGRVVGRNTAFVWDSVNGLRDLNDPSVVSGIPAGVVIETPTDINDSGWITGQANNGDLFILVSNEIPPTPKNRGDVTEDLFVGADDLVRILTHWGESGAGVTWGDGDCAPYGDGITTGDQFVGADDYVEVLSMWGTSYGPEPIPEPATMLLLGLSAGLGLLRRSR